MKQSLMVLFIAIAQMLFMGNGCLDESVRTKVAADGSAERVLSLNLDVKQVPAGAFPVPGDSGWLVEWKDATGGKNKYDYTARKLFRSPEELMREYNGQAADGAVGITVTLNKTFEWFFTYIDYKERFTYHNPFHNIPVTDYLSTQDIERFQRDGKNDTISEKVNQWKMRDQFEDFYRDLINEAKRRNVPDLPVTLLVERKQMFFAAMASADSADKAGRHKSDSTKNKAAGGVKQWPAGKSSPVDTETTVAREVFERDAVVNQILAVLRRVFETDAILSFRPAIEKAYVDADAKEKKFIHPDTWNYSVEMPGMITATNSNSVDGNAVSWKFGPDQVRIGDFTMEASSRITNVWAFIVTGFLAIGAVILAIRRR